MDNKINCHNDVKTSVSPQPDVSKTPINEAKPVLPISNEKGTNQKSVVKKPKESRKLRNCTYQRKYFQPHVPPQKSAPVHVHISNPSAEVFLRERQVEIKDLESQVVYLRNKIKELEIENKTLLDLQARQEKELKKFEGGVADLPSLIKSHKRELKAVETNASFVRRELDMCQKDLKAKNDWISKKDQLIEKLNFNLKRSEKHIQEVNSEVKELKLQNKKYEEENRRLSGGNEEIKSKNDWLQKKMQQTTSTILELEGKLASADHCKSQLQESLCKVQKKYDELLVSEAALKKSLLASKSTTGMQTDPAETASVSCMTITPFFGEGMNSEKVNDAEYEEPWNFGDVDTSNSFRAVPWSIEDEKNASNDFPFFFSSNDKNSSRLDSRLQQKHQIRTSKDLSSYQLFDKRQDSVHGKVKMKNAKQLPTINFKTQTKNFVNKDLFIKHSVSTENRSIQNCDIEDGHRRHSFLDGHNSRSSALNFLSPKLKHFSNLTLK